jgi:hypothetical protein
MGISDAYLANGDYPSDWKEVAKAVKERATWQCEWIDAKGIRCTRKQGDPLPDNKAGWKVVLSVAHLNHVASDCRMDNLKAMCSMHHLRYDALMHAQHAQQTRHRKLQESALSAGQLSWMETGESEA